ncbi:MAG TPA: molybdopterin-dependent oxidoreductase [Acidimicrobiia bacterium]|nr:molybdopterin-dependent oxidoreductase [Acidimicrobiia bacterium]
MDGALAGALAAGAALAVAELIAGFFHRQPSLVTGVGQEVIDRAPGAFVRFGIDKLGHKDKPTLVTGTVVVSLLIGALAGVFARRRRIVGDVVFVAFAVVGWLAALDAAGSSAAAVTVAAIFAGLIGVFGLRALLWRSARPEPKRVNARAPQPMSTRRRFLTLSGAVAVGSAFTALIGRALLDTVSVAAARAKVILPKARRTVAPIPRDASLGIGDVSPLITPNRDFYRIDTVLYVPQVDPEHWTLKVHGRVNHPYELTFDDVLKMPMVEEYVTLQCVSNVVGGPLVGTAKWLGVPLPTLLERADVNPDADQIVGRSVDDFTVGFPTKTALDGRTALLAVGMNGEPLPTVHGFPARLIIAGLYGYVSATKWVTELEATSFADYDAYWVPRGWSQQGPIKTESRIDTPRDSRTVAAGTVPIAGVAWAPTRGIARVEVQIDRGAWQEAELADEITKETWRQWVYRWDAPAGQHEIRVRATDGTGHTQTGVNADPAPNGATGYHTIVVSVS